LDQGEDEAGQEAVGDPHLLAVDHVRVAVLGRARLDRLDVGAQLGLGQREGRSQLARRHLREVLLLLLVRAELHQQVGADEVGVDDPRDRDPAARELLDDHGVGREVQPEPAVLLGDGHPEQPELAHLLDDRLRELVLVVVVLGVGEDLLVANWRTMSVIAFCSSVFSWNCWVSTAIGVGTPVCCFVRDGGGYGAPELIVQAGPELTLRGALDTT
jgi:hypothetical protein